MRTGVWQRAAAAALVVGTLLSGASWAADPAQAAGVEIAVADGGELQAALDSAQSGDTILLEAGRVYEGPFVLPARPRNDSGWITVRTAGTVVQRRGGGGRRVGPGDASRMARLEAGRDAVIKAGAGAHHYRFVDVAIAPAPGVYLHNVIDLGTGIRRLEDLPHSFVFQRVIVRGDPEAGSRRGIALNGGETTIIDSYFSDFKEVGADSQAICGWGGTGPFLIENNYIEAAGENIMFGGADPSISGLVPSDIRIVGNHLSKPLEWRVPGNGQPNWTVKNLLELKNARRVVIDGNLLENSWPAGQTGYAVLFTPRNQEGTAPWSTIEDVTFTNNVVRRTGGGIHFLGTDNNHPSGRLSRVRVSNNLFLDVGQSWGAGRLFLIVDGTVGVTIEHNTAVHTGPAVIADENPHEGFVFRNNIVLHNGVGIIGSGTSPGTDSIRRYFPDGIVQGNVIVGARAGDYPPDNAFPGSIDDLRFANPAGGDYRLGQGSPFIGSGRPPGADLDRIPYLQERQRAVPIRRGAALVLGLSGALLFYVYAGYPMILWLAGRLRSRPVQAHPWTPTISIVVVARNEEARIVRKIDNLLALDYPPSRMEIIVASDGSTDATAERARRTGGRVRVLEFRTGRGKAAVFNAVLPSLSSEIVVLTDARQRLEPGALRAMIADFSDPKVGGVTGELMLAGGGGSETDLEGSGLYWRYEKWIRSQESSVDSCIGMTGAIAAIRRSLFEPLPEDTILDDVLIPLRIIRRGYRVTFEAGAVAWDGYAASSRDEFSRKVRTLAGNFQLFARERWLLSPFRNPLWVQTMSHKVLRLAIPVFLAAAFAANLLLLEVPAFRLLFAGQVLFYAAAAAGAWKPGLRRRVRGAIVPYTICFLSVATMVAFVRFLRNRQSAAWERTAVNEPV